jgi:hypothetical protein
MQEITWTMKNGTEITITVSTDYLLNSQGIRKTGGEKQVVLTATVAGQQHSTIGGLQSVTGHTTCVAKIGDIGLTPERLAPITDAINAAEAEIADHNADLAAHAAKLDSIGTGDINKDFGSHA